MQTIVSDRITILPIINKSKQLILDTYLNNLLIAKNKISTQSIIDSSFQNLLFSKDLLTECNKQFIACKKKLLNYYVNFSNPIFTGWELQKFINSDLIDKELNRIEQFFIQYKASLFTFEKQKRVRKPSKLATLVKLMVKNHYYKGYYYDKIKELINSNPFYAKHIDRIESLALNIFNRYKYHRKPIDYTTPSIIKCRQKDLGLTKPRIIKDNSNSKYQYWYLLDYIDLEDNNLLTECNK